MYELVAGLRVPGRVRFNDTNAESVMKAAYIGFVNGYGGGMFGPNDLLTREQAATLLAQLANSLGKPFPARMPTFADNDKISSWAINEVGMIQAAGIMGGVGNNIFDPRSDYTREQSIISIMRVYKAVGGVPLIVRLENRNITNERLAEMVTRGEIPAGVVRLYLNSNPISDLTPLKSLTKLELLGANETQISDLSPLSSLTTMISLSLVNCRITDITPLGSLTNLKALWLGNNMITNIAPLSGLTGLQALYVQDNNISNISPLFMMTELMQLSVRNNNVGDLSTLYYLPKLSSVWVAGNPLTQEQIDQLRRAHPACSVVS